MSLNYIPKISQPIKYSAILLKYLIPQQNSTKNFGTLSKILPPLYPVLKWQLPYSIDFIMFQHSLTPSDSSHWIYAAVVPAERALFPNSSQNEKNSWSRNDP